MTDERFNRFYDDNVEENDDSTHDELYCVICKGIYQSAVRLVQCQHKFCHDCLENWFEQTLTCPICRMKISLNIFPYTFIDVPQCDEPTIRCSHCGQTDLRRDQWNEHDQMCRMIGPVLNELKSVQIRQLEMNQTLDNIEKILTHLLQSIKKERRKD